MLDIGCGRGLMLIGAAKRLTTGTASGIDLWQAEDLSGNRPEATMENAVREGVADRVDVQTADMRKIPFPGATFDVVVSCSAIHNIYDAAGRRQTIAEIVRVLKPGGEAVIDDIRHGREYAASFAAYGCTSKSTGSSVIPVFLAIREKEGQAFLRGLKGGHHHQRGSSKGGRPFVRVKTKKGQAFRHVIS